jgi:predicted DNA-binding transcriptional regulator AlpA
VERGRAGRRPPVAHVELSDLAGMPSRDAAIALGAATDGQIRTLAVEIEIERLRPPVLEGRQRCQAGRRNMFGLQCRGRTSGPAELWCLIHQPEPSAEPVRQTPHPDPPELSHLNAADATQLTEAVLTLGRRMLDLHADVRATLARLETEDGTLRRWLNVPQAAEYTGRSQSTIRNAVNLGYLRGSGTAGPGSGRWNFRTEDLDAWMQGTARRRRPNRK